MRVFSFYKKDGEKTENRTEKRKYPIKTFPFIGLEFYDKITEDLWLRHRQYSHCWEI